MKRLLLTVLIVSTMQCLPPRYDTFKEDLREEADRPKPVTPSPKIEKEGSPQEISQEEKRKLTEEEKIALSRRGTGCGGCLAFYMCSADFC